MSEDCLRGQWYCSFLLDIPVTVFFCQQLQGSFLSGERCDLVENGLVPEILLLDHPPPCPQSSFGALQIAFRAPENCLYHLLIIMEGMLCLLLNHLLSSRLLMQCRLSFSLSSCTFLIMSFPLIRLRRSRGDSIFQSQPHILCDWLHGVGDDCSCKSMCVVWAHHSVSTKG